MTLTRKLWLIWMALTISGSGVFMAAMVYGGPVRQQFLIGKTTSGHYQIELACNACHIQPFGGAEALQKACLSCHAEELKRANDSHPAKKFTDPRNADRLEKLNATLCVTCHREHNPDITGATGLTLPGDYCYLCHQDVAKDRPSHQELAFSSCASAGCHNFHDNRALYEDFLVKHAGEPETKLVRYVALIKAQQHPSSGTDMAVQAKPLARRAADAPADKLGNPAVLDEWHETAHAQAGVNCSDCHAPKDALGRQSAWTDKPGHKVCASCHKLEAASFVEGKHGMRLHDGLKQSSDGLWGLFKDEPLSPMRPELARAPMARDAQGTELSCITCHGAHSFNTKRSQVEVCLGCHTDDHSKAYLGSPHHKLWVAERRGEAERGTGVSCATCHMPRHEIQDDYGRKTIFVTHNQNDNLRPNDKMARSVCMDCHGLQFTLDSLADRKLTASNFAGRPTVHVQSIEWAMKRFHERRTK